MAQSIRPPLIDKLLVCVPHLNPEERVVCPAFRFERGTGAPRISGTNRMYVTELGAAKPGGTGPVRMDFAVPENALQAGVAPDISTITKPPSLQRADSRARRRENSGVLI